MRGGIELNNLVTRVRGRQKADHGGISQWRRLSIEQERPMFVALGAHQAEQELVTFNSHALDIDAFDKTRVFE